MNWQKILLIIQREYISRVRSKVFIISTLLIPLTLVAYFGLVISMQFWVSEPQQLIGVHDQTGVIIDRLTRLDQDRYINKITITPDSLRQLVMSDELNGYIVLNEDHIEGDVSPEFIYSGDSSITLLNSIRSDLRVAIREVQLERQGVSQDIRNIFESGLALESRKLTESGTEVADRTAVNTGIGFMLGLIIFISIMMYGTIIMKGVLEEKMSRVIEVIVSSVRPVELLAGKILGITGVAVTQFAIWFGCSMLILSMAAPVMSFFVSPGVPADVSSGAQAITGSPAMQIPTIETGLIIAFFVFFILGYFLYSALFVVVGSSVDSESDTQHLMMPLMFLIIVSWILNIEIIQNPNSTLATLSSLFPFFAPVNMMTRIAISDVPIWQISLSVVLMCLSIALTLWISARIYQAGILQYGNKSGFKDMIKWIRNN